jgi:hypothetical protein
MGMHHILLFFKLGLNSKTPHYRVISSRAFSIMNLLFTEELMELLWCLQHQDPVLVLGWELGLGPELHPQLFPIRFQNRIRYGSLLDPSRLAILPSIDDHPKFDRRRIL